MPCAVALSESSLYVCAIFLALLAIDMGLMVSPMALHLNAIASLHYNWAGKMLNIVSALVVLRFCPLTASEIGFTMKQASGSIVPACAVTAVTLVVYGAYVYFADHGSVHTGNSLTPWEEILFQASMPGLSEEMAFRGIYLGLVIRALGGPQNPQGPHFEKEAITATMILTIAFGFGHTFRPPASIDLDAFFFPAFFALVFSWLRLRTGSICIPIMAHSGLNLTNVVVFALFAEY